jgi:hypothetical protein
MAAEWLLHRVVFVVCGDAVERVFTGTLSACGVNSGAAVKGQNGSGAGVA